MILFFIQFDEFVARKKNFHHYFEIKCSERIPNFNYFPNFPKIFKKPRTGNYSKSLLRKIKVFQNKACLMHDTQRLMADVDTKKFLKHILTSLNELKHNGTT